MHIVDKPVGQMSEWSPVGAGAGSGSSGQVRPTQVRPTRALQIGPFVFVVVIVDFAVQRFFSCVVRPCYARSQVKKSECDVSL